MWSRHFCLAGDCTTPLAAHAEVGGEGRLRLHGLVASSDGKSIVRGEAEAAIGDATAAGRRAAEGVLQAGGAAILRALGVEPPR